MHRLYIATDISIDAAPHETADRCSGIDSDHRVPNTGWNCGACDQTRSILRVANAFVLGRRLSRPGLLAVATGRARIMKGSLRTRGRRRRPYEVTDVHFAAERTQTAVRAFDGAVRRLILHRLLSGLIAHCLHSRA